MALDTTKLFTVLGKYVKHTNIVDAWFDELAEDQEELATTLATVGMDDIIDDIPDLYDDFEDDVNNFLTGPLKTRVDEVLLDPQLVVDQLELVARPNTRSILEEISKVMVDSGDSINATFIANGALEEPAYSTTNDNAFEFIGIATLDGVNPPVSAVQPFILWNDIESALFIEKEGVEIRCISDSESGTTRGSERFQFRNGIPVGPYEAEKEGTGSTTLSCINNQSLVPSSFEVFTGTNSATPSGWQVQDGSINVNYSQGVGTGARGTNCFVFTGGINDSVELFTNVGQTLTRSKMYLLACLVKCSDATGFVGSISLQRQTGGEGEGVVVGNSIDLSQVGTDWTLLYQFIIIPSELVGTPFVKISKTNGSPAELLLDDVLFVPVTFYSGLGVTVVAKDGKIFVGDNATFDVTADQLGTFAEFFRKHYKFQLPMSEDEATISDSLAE